MFIYSLSSISHCWSSGALVVVLDMGLAMLSVLCNLMVITSVRRREDMMSLTFNMVTILSKVVVTKIYILKWVDKILIKNLFHI